ncbi:MAG: hypothetical protein HeimC3_46890 [Candidatus Heimdallarchaeota archaeon LC_3]|nr:MAG: hypothetical protein HeimC3_46890 [Candidatus Heimdallarchaeota archaeon LC_3]
MRQCGKCEETDFEQVYGSVWGCKNCQTLSGELKDLEELQTPVKQAIKKIRKDHEVAMNQ